MTYSVVIVEAADLKEGRYKRDHRRIQHVRPPAYSMMTEHRSDYQLHVEHEN